MEFDVSALGEVESVKLNLDTAICEIKWTSGALLTTVVHATEPIDWYSFENITGDLDASIIPPAYVSVKQAGADNPVTGQDVRRLNYDGGKVTLKDHFITYDQQDWSNFKFQAHTQWKPTPSGLQDSWSISSQTSEKESKETAEQLVTKSLQQGIASCPGNTYCLVEFLME